MMENKDLFEVDTQHTSPVAEGVGDGTEPQPPAKVPYYVDLTRDEAIAFHLLLSRYTGHLRHRTMSLTASVIGFLLLCGYAFMEWWMYGMVGYPDPVLLVGAALMLLPVLLWIYIPYRLKKEAGRHYDRKIQAGLSYCGRLMLHPDCIEKVNSDITARVYLDERTLYIENEDMMIFVAQGSMAVVLPGRCLTEELAAGLRLAANTLPDRNRRFIARVKTKGEVVPPPKPKVKAEELWVNTFTYTVEEYTTVLRGILQQHFWKKSPLLMASAMALALMLGYDGTSLLPCIGIFVIAMTLLVVMNLVVPLSQIKGRVETLSTHDLTMQVRMSTAALYVKIPKGAEIYVLWCDVDHVYERDDCVELVHNKRSSLYIPKRCIEDLDALDAAIKRCRGEQNV